MFILYNTAHFAPSQVSDVDRPQARASLLPPLSTGEDRRGEVRHA
jgi:hypothetical protein